MSAKKPPRQTFADIVAEVPDTPEPDSGQRHSYSIPRPWITADGQRWHLRKAPFYEGKALHKLLRRTELSAFHEYEGKRTAIPPDDREQFWDQAVSLMADSAYSDFIGYEYKNSDGDRCLVVYEFC